MLDVKLVEASKEHENQAMLYRQEYIDFGEKEINGSSELIEYEDYDKWLKRIAKEKAIKPSSTHTPSTTYFMICEDDNKIIGSIQLRHHLTDRLRKDGGHVGYGIRPYERGKGYGVKQLSLALEKAKELGLDKIMISCNKDNIPSDQVAIKNGGVMTGEGFDEDEKKVTEIYWINIL